MLACEHDGVRPDVVLLGKALSGGGTFKSQVVPLTLIFHLSDL